MKRNLKLKTIALCMVALLSLTALSSCGVLSKKEITLEQFFENKGKEQLELVKQEVSEAFLPQLGEGGKFEIEVSGNEIIYNLTLSDDLLNDAVKDSLEINLDAMKDIFVTTAAQLKQEIGIEGSIQLTVNYLDTKGELLASRTYDSKEKEPNVVS